MGQLRIHLFGGFLLEHDSVALPPIASRAGRSLFAYLVMNRDRPVQRDLLAGSFWPYAPHEEVHKMRRRLAVIVVTVLNALALAAPALASGSQMS